MISLFQKMDIKKALEMSTGTKIQDIDGLCLFSEEKQYMPKFPVFPSALTYDPLDRYASDSTKSLVTATAQDMSTSPDISILPGSVSEMQNIDIPALELPSPNENHHVNCVNENHLLQATEALNFEENFNTATGHLQESYHHVIDSENNIGSSKTVEHYQSDTFDHSLPSSQTSPSGVGWDTTVLDTDLEIMLQNIGDPLLKTKPDSFEPIETEGTLGPNCLEVDVNDSEYLAGMNGTQIVQERNDENLLVLNVENDMNNDKTSERGFADIFGLDGQITFKDENTLRTKERKTDSSNSEKKFWTFSEAQEAYRRRCGNPTVRASRLPLRDYLGISKEQYLKVRVRIHVVWGKDSNFILVFRSTAGSRKAPKKWKNEYATTRRYFRNMCIYGESVSTSL